MTGFRRAGGRLALTPAQLGRLRAELGVTPRLPGLSPTEVKVLAALRRAPLGLVSVRAAAGRAGVSPTAASQALRKLEGRRLVYREQRTIAAGRARSAQLWHASLLHPDWSELAAGLSQVRLPRRAARRRREDQRVPVRLRHLFWNAKPSQLDVRRAGPFIARRLLRAQDPEGLAWGASHLRPADWREAARARGLDPRVRAQAENLAKSAG